ncbi:MAG: hypothetical protein MPW15_09075 [Candidatus Manganitrophus sp.]|nr:hypothetical protein [Candidatus Manganitrophus sp.]
MARLLVEPQKAPILPAAPPIVEAPKIEPLKLEPPRIEPAKIEKPALPPPSTKPAPGVEQAGTGLLDAGPPESAAAGTGEEYRPSRIVGGKQRVRLGVLRGKRILFSERDRSSISGKESLPPPAPAASSPRFLRSHRRRSTKSANGHWPSRRRR